MVDAYDDDAAVHRQVGGLEKLQFVVMINLRLIRGWYMGASKNRGTPKSSILIGFSIINHPFWGTFIFGNTHIGFVTTYSMYLTG